MSIKKQILKSKPITKVTFKLEKTEANNAKEIYLIGDFNNWELVTPMTPLKDGSFSITLELEQGKEYQFKYLLDKKNWLNDPEADKQVPSSYPDSSNSVVMA